MIIKPLHEWNLTPTQAVQIQKQLASEVVINDELPDVVKTVAGIDLGYDAETDTCRAVVVVLKFPELEILETAEQILPIQFPYIPGLLSFRETPAAIKALEKLQTAPDLILCDGQGLLHPRKFGIACHIGVIADVPTIGVAKSVLIGKFDELGLERGSTSPMIYRGETLGAAVRTKNKVQPVYVSVGHKISLPTAVELVLRCAPKYRLPETTRISDQMASFRKI